MAHISIFVGSVYGGAERLSEQISDTIEQTGHQVSVFAEPSLEDLKNATHILIVTSTTGQGDIPANLAELYNQLNSTFPMLTNKPFGIVAMGDRSYGDTFCLIPFTLKKFNIDPAVAGSVVLTTVTDVVGFFAFLGLGAIFLI